MKLPKHLVALLCACAAVSSAPAHAAGGWLDGATSYTYAVNCASTILGAPYLEALSGHIAGSYVNEPQQGVGEVFYVRTIVTTLGAPCAGPYAVPELALHRDMELAISPQYPVICYVQLPGGSRFERVGANACPQQPQPGRLARSVRFAPPGQGGWALPQGAWVQVQVPVYVRTQFKGMAGPDDKENCGGCFFAPSQMLDGGSDPTGFAKQWVTTDKTYPGTSFPAGDKPLSMTGPNSVTLTAYLYNNFAPGKANLAICEAARYHADTHRCDGFWRETAPATVTADSRALELTAAIDGIKPSTAYKAMVFFDFEQPEEGGAIRNGTSRVVSFTSGPLGVADPGAPAGDSANGGPPPANAPAPPSAPPVVDSGATTVTPGDVRNGAEPNKPLPGGLPPAPAPGPAPVPAPEVPAALATVAAPPGVKRAALLKRGLRVPLECRRSCRVALALVADGRAAKRAGLARSAKRPVVVGRAVETLAGAGRATVAVPLSARARKAFRRARRLTLTLRSTATEAGAAPLVAEQLVAVK